MFEHLPNSISSFNLMHHKTTFLVSFIMSIACPNADAFVLGFQGGTRGLVTVLFT